MTAYEVGAFAGGVSIALVLMACNPVGWVAVVGIAVVVVYSYATSGIRDELLNSLTTE